MSNRRDFLKTGLGGLAGCTALASLGAHAARAPALQTQPVAGRVSVIGEAPGNVTVLSAGDGVMLVDSGSTQQAPAVRKLLGKQRVHTLFNTHYHADQTGGNALFAKAGAQIHAQTITKQWLAADYYSPEGDRWIKAPPKEAVPTVTFRDWGEMKVGEETVQFGYLLEAHTRGDAYVFFRDSNVLVAGDVVSPLRDPVLDWYAGGWLGGRADAMDDLLEIVNEQTLIVPAYGKVMTYAELQAERDYITKLYDLISDLYHHGNSAQDILNKGVLNEAGRELKDPYRFLYDVVKGLQAHYTNFGGNVV
ncbi:MAG: MBL fold metallo-hydrolase [Nevskiaceae bacterium]|nr:MBL fold metallo-hydrolase [Nevskiaceae bacterium]